MPHGKNIHSNPSVVKYCDECTPPKQSEEKVDPIIKYHLDKMICLTCGGKLGNCACHKTPDQQQKWVEEWKQRFCRDHIVINDQEQIDFITHLLDQERKEMVEKCIKELGKINFLEGITGKKNRELVINNYRKFKDNIHQLNS